MACSQATNDHGWHVLVSVNGIVRSEQGLELAGPVEIGVDGVQPIGDTVRPLGQQVVPIGCRSPHQFRPGNRSANLAPDECRQARFNSPHIESLWP